MILFWLQCSQKSMIEIASVDRLIVEQLKSLMLNSEFFRPEEFLGRMWGSRDSSFDNRHILGWKLVKFIMRNRVAHIFGNLFSDRGFDVIERFIFVTNALTHFKIYTLTDRHKTWYLCDHFFRITYQGDRRKILEQPSRRFIVLLVLLISIKLWLTGPLFVFWVNFLLDTIVEFRLDRFVMLFFSLWCISFLHNPEPFFN